MHRPSVIFILVIALLGYLPALAGKSLVFSLCTVKITGEMTIIALQDSVLNVRQFGATGDGKHNDGPAIQRAIDAAAKAQSPLYVPAGNYYIAAGNALTIPSGVSIKGSGKAYTRLITDSTANPAFPSLINIEGEQIVLSGMSVSGGRPVALNQKSTQASGRYSIINISFDTKASENVRIEDCLLSDAYGRAIIFRGRDITIQDCDFLRVGRYNINFKAVDGAISNFGRNECADIRIIHNTFRYAGTHAISAYRINRLTIEDNYLSQISGIGLANHQCQNLKITGNRIEYTGDNGIDVQRCQQTLIANNYFYCAGNKNAGDAGSAAAIFYGDDYANGTANNAVISDNFIRGEFKFDVGVGAGRSQSCGIYVIDAFHVKVLHNTINGIGDNGPVKKINGIEDGNGIMIVNSAKGQSRDVLVDGNSVYDTKNNGLFIGGQSRDIKVINNTVTNAGGHGIYLRPVATNLFGAVKDNIVTDGRNWFGKEIAADIFIEAENGWITHLNISGNQLRNTKRANNKSLMDSVNTTHGIYFEGKGFVKVNNLIVADNQISGHSIDEIGFSEAVASYSVVSDKPFPITGFRDNYSGSTDDQPQLIIPGYNQRNKPWIITESYAPKVPEYGNYSKGSVIHNPNLPPQRWVALNSGFAAQNRWEAGRPVRHGQTIVVGTKVWRCVNSGRTGSRMFSTNSSQSTKGGNSSLVLDGTVTWEPMGDRVLFKAFAD